MACKTPYTKYGSLELRMQPLIFNDIMTVEDLIDLAAFLKSLGGERPPPSHGEHGHYNLLLHSTEPRRRDSCGSENKEQT